MGLFDKFKKKNIKSIPEKINEPEEPKTDDRIELTLDNLYGELANTILFYLKYMIVLFKIILKFGNKCVFRFTTQEILR